MRKLCAVFALSLLPLATASLGAQDSGESLPRLISHADAQYPVIARTAHVMGDVVVRITTDGQSVVAAQAESGPALLQRASVDNAKTWKFAPHTAGMFHITYHYDFAASDAAAATSFPNSSDKVEVKVVVPAPEAIIEYAWIGLGTWNAELMSPHGKLSHTLEFAYSGPDIPETLRVESGRAPGDAYDYGQKDGGFLAFSMKLVQPDGKQLKTYLVCKMSRTKLVGTFVDESGVRGTWTATRIPDAEKK
jgi:hypothetical protein